MTILSIQSAVAYGHVGNSAAVFPLQRLGFEVWPVNTVSFSNHPGYGHFKGTVTPALELAGLVNGIGGRRLFPECQAVLSGYLGSAENGHVVRDAVLMSKEMNPGSLYCCDPIIGDWEEGIYVDDAIPAFLRDHLVPLADMVTPNAFELEQLTGRQSTSVDEVAAAAAQLAKMGPRLVAVTSLRLSNDSEETINTLLYDRNEDQAWVVETPRLNLRAKGTGDCFTALLLGAFLKQGKAKKALNQACATLFGIIDATVAADGEELLLIAAQEEIAAPSSSFKAVRVG